MKALFFGSTHGKACALHYFTSLIRLGIQTIPFDPEYFASHSVIEKALIKINKGPTRDRVERTAEDLINLCKHNHFDFVFNMAENFLSAEVMTTIRDSVRNPPLFLYHSHDNNFSSGICKPHDFESALKAYDFVYTTKSQNVERYKKLGQPRSYFIPSAYEPNVHLPIPDADSRWASQNIRVSFVGTYDQSRDPICELIGWQNLHVWGDHWKRSPHFTRQYSHIVPKAVFYFEFADIISHSKISLGLLRIEANDLHTQRTFEIPACGGFQIAPRNEEIQTFFNENEDIVLYDSLEELKDKCGYYLEHESERKEIAHAGFRKVTSGSHTYVDRVQVMLNLAGLSLGKARKVQAL